MRFPRLSRPEPRACAAALVALALSASPSLAGPCMAEIAQAQAAVDARLEAVAGAGPMGSQSVGAQLHRQPTPGSMAQAESRLGDGSAGNRAVAGPRPGAAGRRGRRPRRVSAGLGGRPERDRALTSGEARLSRSGVACARRPGCFTLRARRPPSIRWPRTTSSSARSTRSTGATRSPRSGIATTASSSALAILLVVAVGGWRYWQYAEQRPRRGRGRALPGGAAARPRRQERGSRAGARRAGEGRRRRLRPARPLPARRRARPRRTRRRAPRPSTRSPPTARSTRPCRISRACAPRPCASTPTRPPRSPCSSGSPRRATRGGTPRASSWRSSRLKRGDYEAAGRWVDQMAADREAPPSQRPRLETYSALVAAGPVQPTQ